MLREMIRRGVLLSFFLMIALGNLPRFNGFLILEPILYLLCFLYTAFRPVSRNLVGFGLLVALSFLWGCLQQGFDLEAGLYALRLVALIFAGVTIAQTVYEKFQGNLMSFFAFLIKAYVVALICSFVIYFLFPESTYLWIALEQYHIVFKGDPHVDRLVSVYFDPNFYGAIGCIPFILSSFLFYNTKKVSYFFAASLFVISIFLTKSRSGIVLFSMLFCFMSFLYLKRNRHFAQTRGRYLLILTSCIVVAGVLFQQGLLGAIVERLSSIPNDPSAGFRFQSLKNGMDALLEKPLFGIGYNFLPKIDLWIDSSLLLFALCFGICLTVCFMIYFAVTMYNLLKKSNRSDVVRVFVFYIIFSVLFFSFFNQLISYPFWALPVLVIYNFLKEMSYGSNMRRC